MSIEVAKSAGFCFGVKRAVEKTYELSQRKDKNIVTYGPIIHNENVVSDLKKNGVNVCLNLKEITDDSLVIIRAHGVGKGVYDYFEENNIEYVDLTCPFVKKIHKIVSENYKSGKQIVVIGKKDHPEVVGINGWCNESAIILYNENEVEIPDIIGDSDDICVVAQTTVNKEKFYKYIKFLKNTCKKVHVFDTICSATYERQTEAVKLSEKADVAIVVGGLHSSNSFELYNKCKEVCDNTYLINDAKDLESVPYHNKKIAITAGASTPAYIIKEVLNIMSEKTMPASEENFADLLEDYLNAPIYAGKVIKGTVDRVSVNEVNVNIPGFKGVGIISVDNLSDDPQFDPEKNFKFGDEIEAMVIKKNDVEGTVILSKKKVDQYKNAEVIKEAFETKKILKGKVVEINKGGVAVLVDGFKIFVPNSLATERMSDDKSLLLNTEVSLKVIDYDEKRRGRAVGSIKAVIDEEKKAKQEEFWSNVSVDKVYEGKVKSLTNFGAFVDLGGVDGLIHISELSWGRIKHPSEVVNVGDIVTVFIKEIDAEKKKISLGFKKAEDNPWIKIEKEYNVGDVVDCKIVRLVPFGAFAEIIPFVDGLIHISQIADKRIEKPADVLTVGETVKAKIVEIDLENKKISLSIRALLKEEEPANEAAEEVPEETSNEASQEEITKE